MAALLSQKFGRQTLNILMEAHTKLWQRLGHLQQSRGAKTKTHWSALQTIEAQRTLSSHLKIAAASVYALHVRHHRLRLQHCMLRVVPSLSHLVTDTGQASEEVLCDCCEGVAWPGS